MKHFKKIVLVLAAFGLLMILLFISQEKEPKSQKPQVATSSFALYDIAKHIAAESVQITNILPFGVDVHSFEPTPKLLASLEQSDLIFYSGAGLEPWIEGFVFKGKSLDMSEHVTLRELDSQASHEHNTDHNEHCAHVATDPHYWLDLQNMAKATEVITHELIKLSPQNATFYTKNKEVYLQMLLKLDEVYASKLKECVLETIIVNHNAFSYLSKRYGFHVEALSGLSPEAQPSPKNMAKLIEHIKEEGTTTIFFENFVSDKAIKSISYETNASVDVLQPLGNITADEAARNLSYEDIMRQNLDKISKALMCK
ncbi:MAG TPA: ABC transporter substrate-binding protein [Sulfurimonas sp. UBA12504]|nr:MAG: ABC transporter substrate-binding protein [Sulfurimonas sp. GWF2_37_8]DAB29377.1 MAG TPA: ABC transporter substrate-binding protein [Sulfurimonas sp. UBA12504]